ncbi:MAG TPA: methyltransferase domain-containing protein [Geothrix sp.]|nr:methyltransferase domain-containing protein [Geothrix sp.]
MINQLIRYEPALRWIARSGFQKICEVGSGQNGICKFLDQKIVGMDINFKDYQEQGEIRIHSNLAPIFGDILAGTAFRDQEFDLVICVDMLEHIPKSDRQRAIQEIIRIGKHAFIALPEGHPAQACDRWLADFLVRRGRTPPEWLFEHLDHDFPEAFEVGRILDAIPDVVYTTYANDNVAFHKWVVLLEIYKFARFSDRISRHRWIGNLLRPFNAGQTYRRIYQVSHPDSGD